MAYFKPAMLTNLVHIKDGLNLRQFKVFGSRQQQKKLPIAEEFKLATRIVKKAIYTLAPNDIADKIINDFRRSDGSDDAAEINFLQSDIEYKEIDKDYHYNRALKVCEKLFKPHRELRPVAYPDLRYYPWTLPTSAEAPFTHKRRYRDQANEMHKLGINPDSRINFHNFYNQIFVKNRHLIHKIKTGDSKFWTKENEPIPYYWHSLHTRAHLVKINDPDKNRAVFGTPKLLLMAENMFLWPLSRCYLNRNIHSPLLWGYETFKGGWNRLYTDIYNKTKPNTFLGLDWSGFDRRSRFTIIDDVHKIWRSYFTFKDGYEPTNEYPSSVDKDRIEKNLERLWKWTTYSIKYTPIRASSGNTYQFLHTGIASGLQETQLLDSFVNTIVTLTCLSSLGINIESEHFIYYVQGDDSLVCLPELIYLIHGQNFLSLFAKEADDRFGFKLNVEKSKISNALSDIDVLSYSNRYGHAYRDTNYILSQLVYPERKYRNLGATASAAIGIAMASMGNDKLTYDICYDIWRHITQDLKVIPKPIFLNRYFTYIAQELMITGTEFPELIKLKDQQYHWNKERKHFQKLSLWPTENKYGFYFLYD